MGLHQLLPGIGHRDQQGCPRALVFTASLLATTLATTTAPVLANSHLEERIARAAAPAAISKDATIAVDGEVVVEGLPDDPSGGGPYVMWDDTPYAHIMIPVSD